jgi:AcrR family transcriptional regulator
LALKTSKTAEGSIEAVAEKLGSKDRILASAIRAIDKGGEKSLKIRQICSETETTAPSVYYFFGSRDGLIEAAQAARYLRGQRDLSLEFSNAVHACKTKSDFTAVAHRFLEQMFSFERRPIRSVRVNVLGSSQTRKNLAKAIAQVQLASNKIGGEPIRFAQDMGWVRPDFNPEMYLAWLTGMVNAQLLIELDGNHPDRADWVVIAKRSVCLLLGIPEPKYVKPKSKTK